jgi:hypothetical protein
MNFVYKRIYQYVNPEPGSVFLEIGSERGEGSTDILAQLAQDHGTKLITVDLDDLAKQRNKAATHPNIEWHLGKPGSEWCKDVWPTIAQPISMLYLDNFDWNWVPESDMYIGAINEYRDRWQLEMSNAASQLEHFTQFLLLEPYLSQNAVVACDDTLIERGVWTGKCGPIVVYLLAKGWKLQDRECGVLFTR